MSPELAPRPAPSKWSPRVRRVRLVWTLLAVLLVTALVPLFLTAYKLIEINRESLEAASREYQLEVAAAIVQDLNGVLSASMDQLTSTAHYLQSQLERTSMDDPLRGDSILAPYLAGNVKLMRYTSRQGTVLEVGDRGRTRNEALSSSLFEAFANAMGGEVFVGRPADPDPSVGPCVVAAVPVKVRGEVRGVLAGVINLKDSWDRSVATLGAPFI